MWFHTKCEIGSKHSQPIKKASENQLRWTHHWFCIFQVYLRDKLFVWYQINSYPIHYWLKSKVSWTKNNILVNSCPLRSFLLLLWTCVDVYVAMVVNVRKTIRCCLNPKSLFWDYSSRRGPHAYRHIFGKLTVTLLKKEILGKTWLIWKYIPNNLSCIFWPKIHVSFEF